jgi:HK97 family phage major capsid protein
MDTIQIKRKISDTVREMRALIDLAEDQKRDLTPSESAKYKVLDGQVDKYKAELDDLVDGERRLGKLTNLEKEINKVTNPLPTDCRYGSNSAESGDTGGFENVAELLFTIAAQRKDGRNDPRLTALAEKREQSMGTGSQGGFAIPDRFDPMLRLVPGQTGIVRQFATQIPAGYPPDALLTLPALDQTSGTGGMFGGVQITHGGEGVSLTESSAKLREVTLEPRQLNTYLVVSNKLLLNWASASQVITTLLQSAVEATIDYDCIRGDGINKALGFVNCAAAVNVTRGGAGAISFTDVTGMYARLLQRPGVGRPIWVASPTAIPQLFSMTDAGNHAIFLGALSGGAAQAPAPTLLGLPLFFSDRAPALGSKGDICLVDLSYYLLLNGSGPRIDLSTELLFTSDKSIFRIIAMLDGRPWLTEPITLEGSSTSTVSPFVVLAA